MNVKVSDYGNGYSFRWCCLDQACGLGDLTYNDQVLIENVTQREAREFQSKHEKACALPFGS
jgi:hypothetical protein